MNILITAIGSMSAECVINQLKSQQHYIVGCDIYPYEWHYESALCDKFYQAPLAKNKDEYIQFLLDVCASNHINHIIPLTDLEIDIINEFRYKFAERGIVLCMQSEEVLAIARNKYQLYTYFSQDAHIPSIPTSLMNDMNGEIGFPCIAKPYNGRSSEGLSLVRSKAELDLISNKDMYIVQQFMEGSIYTVDYIRHAASGRDMAVPRVELLRTKNGAGLTVQVVSDQSLNNMVAYIGQKLNINGCVNMEFIKNGEQYYLIDINPRFSAGVAFSVLSGYDMVNNHLNCFTGHVMDAPVQVADHIMVKKYSEKIIQ